MNYQILPEATRVWIYQSNKPFDEKDLPSIQAQIVRFTRQWVSHNSQLRAFGNVFHNRFIVLMVDESQTGASGCSIDASVQFIKNLERTYGIDLFDRMTFAYRDGEFVKTVPREEFARLYKDGKINDETLVFDNLVTNKGDFEQNWLKPLGKSWHKQMV
jgi:hypothetical protein